MSTILELIDTKTATSVSNVSITNCFSADYDAYKVILDTIDFASGDLKFRLINASGVVSSSHYDDAVSLMRSYGVFGENQTVGGTEFGSIGFSDLSNKGGATVIDIYNPFSSSLYTAANWQNAGVSSIGTPVRKGLGLLRVAESHTGINFLSSATILNVRARVYGVKAT